MWREVLVIAAHELGKRHWRVDVIERGGAAAGLRHPVADANPLRHVGTDDGDIGVAYLASEPLLELLHALIELRTSARRVRQVAVARVPGLVALEEEHVVPAADEVAHEPAIGRRVPVAPRARDRQPDDDD